MFILLKEKSFAYKKVTDEGRKKMENLHKKKKKHGAGCWRYILVVKASIELIIVTEGCLTRWLAYIFVE